jgi:beta-galactosidase GanA
MKAKSSPAACDKHSSFDNMKLLLAGELGNSIASDPRTLRDIWPRLVDLGLNTVLAPVYWDLVEPEEGRFEFELVDELLRLARASNQRLVLLWFGSWKNSMSCYAPHWVKLDQRRFPRARLHDGSALEILTAFSQENLDADRRAFAQLMRYLKACDGEQHTIALVQVENEVGMLEQARDACDAANQAFRSAVPADLIRALADRPSPWGERLEPFLDQRNSTWTDVFGEGSATDELFQAYFFAKYVDAVAEAGKREYAVPMFVNAALNRPGARPGQYPSGGPLPHLFDVWKAAAPHLDLLSPDIYLPDFEHWCSAYHSPDNRLFVPEATGGAECAVHALYAIGATQALGFSPFAVEQIDPTQSLLPACYRALASLEGEIAQCRAHDALGACLLTRNAPTAPLFLGGYRLDCSHDYTWEWSGPSRHLPDWPKAGALVLATQPDEFLVVGSGVIVTFGVTPPSMERVGILTIEELELEAGELLKRRVLSGDETHQGRHLRIAAQTFGVQRIRLYRYR